MFGNNVFDLFDFSFSIAGPKELGGVRGRTVFGAGSCNDVLHLNKVGDDGKGDW